MRTLRLTTDTHHNRRSVLAPLFTFFRLRPDLRDLLLEQLLLPPQLEAIGVQGAVSLNAFAFHLITPAFLVVVLMAPPMSPIILRNLQLILSLITMVLALPLIGLSSLLIVLIVLVLPILELLSLLVVRPALALPILLVIPCLKFLFLFRGPSPWCFQCCWYSRLSGSCLFS